MSSRRPRADWSLIGFHALAATGRRPGKSVLTALGVALGIAVFLVTVGWSQTVGSQINQTFDQLAATQVRIRDTRAETATDAPMPDDFEQLIAAVPGVVAGGRLWEAGVRSVTSSPGASAVDLTLLVTDPGFLVAADVQIASGRLPDAATVALAQPVVVLGPGAADQLHLDEVRPGLAVDIGTTRLMVIGILGDVGTAPELDSALVVSPRAPVGEGNTVPDPLQMSALVRVRLGTASHVANALPLAVRPQDVGRLGVIVAPEPTSLRDSVQTSLDTLAYGAAALSLVIGAIGIMNSMLMSVSQRSGEIGLRRSLGAGRRHVVVQFLGEGALLGLTGAIVGTLCGELGLLGVAAANGWNPVLDRTLLLASPLAGLLIGILASLHPALRAATIDPATTLRT